MKFRFFFLLFILIIKVETGFVKCIKETSGIVILILYIYVFRIIVDGQKFFTSRVISRETMAIIITS